MHNAGHDDANDELTLPDQPLGEDFIAALRDADRERLISYLLYTGIAISPYLIVETVALAGIGRAVLVARHQLGHILQYAAGFRYGAIALGVLPRRRLIEIVIVRDATAAKVAHQLVPHQRRRVHVLTQRIVGDGGLQEFLALAAHLLLVEGGQTAGHQLRHEQQYQQGAVLRE